MNVLGWAIAAAALVCVVLRPHESVAAAARGSEVYLFLIGMMVLAGVAGAGGCFDWVAARAVRIAGGSRLRLFALVYAAGIVTTALFSNDATIVVLTPAVIAVLRDFDAAPLPYVTACALIANAASFLLPIANPSNLLVFAGRVPPLGPWLAAFGLPSVAAIGVTFAIVWWCYRQDLSGEAAPAASAALPPAPAVYSVVLLAASACVILTTSALGGPLGSVTFACSAVALLWTAVRHRQRARTIASEVSWRVVALTGALFVVVSTLDDAGGFALSRSLLAWCAHLPAPGAALATGFTVAVAANAVNNLPVGLNLGETLPAMHASLHTASAALVGVNLGPNATVNGSLATLLWLTILRRENIAVPAWGFARVGILATIPALAAALVLL